MSAMCNDAFVAGFFCGWLMTGVAVLASLIYRRWSQQKPKGTA